ncbi:MAG: carboxypeptidase-like regulatory domain-containing protein [Prevotella sp.]|nr:carboxypeptidase-like regulatory domain-containing protein [Prevotella sp.]
MKKTTILCLLSLLAVISSMAQQTAHIAGYVLNADSEKPISGANVSATGQTVVTNDDGYFLLKTDSLPVRLVISHIGYHTLRMTLSSVPAEPLCVALSPTTVQLHEVLVVAGSDPRELVEAAVSRIPHNYSRQPERYQCFYRETAMKRQRHIMVAEGVVEMYKTAYGRGNGRDRVAIRKGRRLLSPRTSDTLSVKVTGGPVTPIQLDIVKDLDILLSKEELDGYELHMEPPTAIGNRPQYVVSLKPLLTRPYPLYFGKLYIDRQTLAFTRAELSLDMSDRDKATSMMLVRKPLGVRFRPKELSLLIDYHQDGSGISRLSYIRTTFRFNCDWRRRLFATSFTAVCEMVVTSHDDATGQKPIAGRESFDQRDAFFDKVDYFRDPAFWQHYNIIEPTESLDRAIDRLLKRSSDAGTNP